MSEISLPIYVETLDNKVMLELQQQLDKNNAVKHIKLFYKYEEADIYVWKDILKEENNVDIEFVQTRYMPEINA